MEALAWLLRTGFNDRMPIANAAMSLFLGKLRDCHLGKEDAVVPTLAAMAEKLTIKDGVAALCPAASFPNEDSIKQSFMDWTGFESFANHVHIEDFSVGMDALQMLGQAIGFSKLIQGKTDPLGLALRFIVGLDKFEDRNQCIFRFHVIRTSESWLADNLDGYSEPVLTWDSSESVF